MLTSNIEIKLKQVISEHLGVDEEEVIHSAHFVNDLDADSLDAMDLLMAVNEEFGIRIPAEELMEIQTVQDMFDKVKASIKS